MAAATSDFGIVDNWQGERTLAECTLHMLTTHDGCDVHFRVGPKQETVNAHRFILISRSCVFHAMFCGPLAEEQIIRIPDVTKEPFMEFLKFLYTDDCALTADNVTAVLYLSKKYAVYRLQKRCLRYLEIHLTAENACVVLDQAHLYDEKNLQDKSLEVIKQNGEVCLESPGFKEMSKRSLDMVLSSFDSHLEAVFKAALSWAAAECERTGKDSNPSNKKIVLGESIFIIGFTGFDAKTFVKTVIPSQVLSDNEIIKVMSYLACPAIDVKPFRLISGVVKFKQLELDLYGRSRSPIQSEVSFVEGNSVCDKLSVKANFDMFLESIVLAPMQGTYEVIIENRTRNLETVQCVSKVTSSKLDCGINIPGGAEFTISVFPKDGKCPSQLMSDLRAGIHTIADSDLNIAIVRKEMFLYRTMGMIKKLLVQKSVDLGD